MERMELGNYLVTDPCMCDGALTFRGTRLLVADVLEMVAKGMDWDDIIRECHQSIGKDAIAEAVRLASEALRGKSTERPAPPVTILKGCTMVSFSTNDVKRALAPLAGDPMFQRINVSEFRPEFGEDANGDPAIWVYVLIPDEVPPELVGGAHFEERFRVRDALEAAGWAGPVYTRFRLASEDLALRRPAGTK